MPPTDPFVHAMLVELRYEEKGHDTYYESCRILEHRVRETPNLGKRHKVHWSGDEALASVIARQAISSMINQRIGESGTGANLILQASSVSLFFKKNTVSISEYRDMLQ